MAADSHQQRSKPRRPTRRASREEKRSVENYFAFASTWNIPNTLSSVSRKYPCQQTPGTANLASATLPPSLEIFCAVLSKSSTSMEHTKLFVPLPGGGTLAGRLSRPPLGPS